MSDRINTIFRIFIWVSLPIIFSACMKTEAPAGGPPAPNGQQRTKEQNIELGRQHKTASDLFQALRDEAKGG